MAQAQRKDDILDLVGGDGPWQRRIFLVVSIFTIPLASHNLVMSFFAPNLDHWCSRPQGSNLTVAEWRDIGLPPDDPKCSRYKTVTFPGLRARTFNGTLNRETIECDSWEYDNSTYASTVLSEWNLVCHREWLISMSKSIFIGGYLFSVIVFGYLADKYGRRPVIAICNLIAVVSAVTCVFSVSFMMFAVTRFFIAVGIAGAFNTAFVLLMEVIGPEYRSCYGLAMNLGWNLGYVSLPLIAWLLKDWFWIQIVITLPLLFLLSCWWLLPESPRWLLSHGKTKRTFETLSVAGKANGVKMENKGAQIKEMIVNTSKAHGAENVSPDALQLCSLGLWRKSSVIFYVWFVIAFVYYGISYNTNELAGDPFVNFAAYGIVEIPANILSIFITRSLGRRNPLAFTLVAAGAACLLMYPIPRDPWWISVTVSLIGKFCITCAFGIVYVFTAELFPTIIRNIGVGAASTSARLGSIIAPFVRELGHATHAVVPQIIFGILAGVAGIMVLFLPETNNQSIPDTLKEAAEITRNRVPQRKPDNVILKELKKEEQY